MLTPDSSSWKFKYLIANLFFLFSGFSSLIYQVIWTRQLVFVFGSTTFATSTVLSVFMGGLALGSFLAGKYADKARKPFLIYGVLEGIIGLWALLTPGLFELSIPIYKMFFEQLHQQIVPFGLLRFLVVAIILIIPTSCMGATLPLLSKFITGSIEEVGDRVGNLYAMNTLGAVLGSISAGFFLIPGYGLAATTYTAVSVNILLAVSVFFLLKSFSKEQQYSTAQAEATNNLAEKNEQKSLSLEVKIVMLSFAISGALAMIYEVAWTRSLLMVIGSTTYAFTVMLSTFLIGIAAGSFVAARIVDRLKNPLLWFAASEIWLCLAGFFSLLLFNYLPDLNLALASSTAQDPFVSMLLRFMAAGGIMVPITLCLGFIFPVAVKICSNDLKNLGRSIGSLYAANTCGAIIGAFLAGFLIIPAIGSEQALAFASVSNLMLGLLILLLCSGLRKPVIVLGLVSASAILAAIFTTGIHIWDINSILYAQSERRQLLPGSTHTKALLRGDDWLEPQVVQSRNNLRSLPELLFYKEGPCANVAVTKASPPALGTITTLFTNGHADASDSLDMENQAMLSVLPLLLKPASSDVCVVGWGSGVTSGYGLLFPIKSLVSSEIEPIVIDTSKYFHHVNFSPEKDSRSIIEPSDGRNYLLGTGKKFDVVISEPSNPWQAGVCNLFTQEYFRISAAALKSSGMFSMWNQINEMPTRNLVQVYAALKSVYPNIFVFDSGTGDTIAIASIEKLKINLDEINRALNLPGVKGKLQRLGINNAEDLVARIRICPAGLEKATRGSLLNTDDLNHLEFDVARSYESKSYAQEDDQWFLSNAGPIWDYIDWGKMTAAERAREMLKIARQCLPRSPERLLLWAEESIRTNPTADAYALIAQLQILMKDYAAAKASIEHGLKMFPENSALIGLDGVVAIRNGNYAEARALLEKAIKQDRQNYSLRYFLALCFSQLNLGESDGIYNPPPTSEPEKVVELCEEAIKDQVFVHSKPASVLLLADAYIKLAKNDEAIRCLKPLLAQNPKISMGWSLMARAYDGKNDKAKSDYCNSRALYIARSQAASLFVRAGMALKNKNTQEAAHHAQHILELFPFDPEALKLLSRCASHSKEAASYLETVSRAQQQLLNNEKSHVQANGKQK